MKYLAFMLLLASSLAHAQEKFEVRISPSFHPACSIKIAMINDRATMSVRYGDLERDQEILEEYHLDKVLATSFFIRMKQYSVHQEIDYSDMVLDGVIINGRFTEDRTSVLSIRAHSPHSYEHPRDSAIMELLQDTVRLAGPSDSLLAYMEQLSIYLDHPFPAIVIGGDPFIVKLYGSIGSGEDQQLRSVFIKIPSDKSVIIDMRNFSAMGTILYPIFKELLKKNNKITWLAQGYAKKQLLEIGVEEVCIDDPCCYAAFR